MQLDLLLTHANAITLDESRPTARTLGVWNGRFVGVDEEVEGMSAKETVDLGGSTVLPGFNDVHCHTSWFGLTLASVDVEHLPGGLPEVYAKLAEAAQSLPDGEWINATGYSHHDYEGQYPDIGILDKLAEGRPLVIRQVSGHSSIANTKALELAGVLEDGFTDPEGGKVVRGADGRPTGLIEETAQNLVLDLVRPYSVDTLVNALDLATAYYAKEGITSFGDAGIASGWIGHSPIELTAYMRARAEGKLHARGQLMPAIQALHEIAANPADDFGIGLDLGLTTGFGDEVLSIGPTKIYMDGALSGETAALSENYPCKCHAGYLQADEEWLRRVTLDAYRSGWSVAVHAIGDLAVTKAIENIVEAQTLYGRRAIPNRIEHAAMVTDDQLPVLAEHGIAVTPQAAFFDSIGDGMAASLGEKWLPTLYRGAGFVRNGVLMPGSSDRPCAEGNVLRGIQAFVDRKSRSGVTIGPEAECLTPAEAVTAYTKVSAEASGHGALKGTLSAGKLADLVVLGASPMEVDPTTIKDIPVHATLMGGTWTHNAL
ncbi:amidohydrolase [Brevibacterium samyangense]|uniref:Amidohydrolase n=1 Tax=Brevibacterium samyangense TaxID=366888 RepID=A0ABN2TLA3_9MICO